MNLLYSIPIMFLVFFLCCEVSMHLQPIVSAMRRWESLPGLRKQLNPEELDALAEQAPLTPGDE